MTILEKRLGKGGIMSEDTGRFLLLQKYIPTLCPKLLHPVHGIDKMSIVNCFAFTGLIYLQIVQIIYICLEHTRKVSSKKSICKFHFINVVFFNLHYIKSNILYESTQPYIDLFILKTEEKSYFRDFRS